MLRYLLAVHHAPEHELTFVLNNMARYKADVFYHLFIARDVIDGDTGERIDPNDLFGVPTNKRDMVYMLGNASYGRFD